MKKWIGFLTGILLLAAAFLAHHSVVHSALRTLPEAALATASRGISVQAFSALSKVKNVTPVLKEPGYLQGHSVTAYYTTADAPALCGVGMLYGSFSPWQDGDIVIGRALAAELFMTENAVGLTVRYNGREYIVRGVYAPPEDIVARMSRTVEPEVWLPLASYPDQDAGIGEYLVGLHGGLKGSVHYTRFAPELELRLGTNLTFHSAYNFDETRRLAGESESLLGLLFALSFCVLCGYWAVRLGMGLFKAVRDNTDDSLPRALGKRRREVFLFAVSLLCLAGGAFWTSKAGFTLFLPQDYITGGKGIVDYIVGNFQLRNGKADLFLCAYSSHVKTVLALLDVCIAVLLVKTVYRAARAVKAVQDRI